MLDKVIISKKYYIKPDGKLYRIIDDSEFIPKAKPKGYYMIYLNKKYTYIHHLVMELFGPPKPGPEYQIDHINRIPDDNRIENLRWVTPKENMNNRHCSLNLSDEEKYERKKEQCRISREKHKLERNEYSKNYCKEHRAERTKKYKEWLDAHREEYNAKRRERRKLKNG